MAKKKRKKKPTYGQGIIKPRKVESKALSPLLSEDKEKKIAIALIVISYIIYVAWGILSNGTWDDDCVGRYYNTIDAFNNPKHFIDLWNRPLFVVLFALPLQLGKFMIPVIMPAFSAISAWLLYKSARMLGLRHALLVVPFLLFQAFFIGIGRDAMTEPLAVTIISAGIYFSLKEKWMAFVLVGSLLPLARTELAVFLVLWAVVLLLKKQWKLVPFLATGIVLWNVGGWIIDGDPLYLYNAIFTNAAEENRYGHQAFNTYFSRYFYLVGPVVFFFLIQGLIDRILKKDFSLLILIQFIVGFWMYTIFAWKLTIGQSAGFLRNLLPLSPMVALIALYGYNFWLKGILLKKRKVLVILLAVITTAITAVFWRNNIKFHHKISDEFDLYNIPIVASLFLITVLMMFLYKKGDNRIMRVTLMAVVAVFLVGHTLVTEPPNANMNSERYLIEKVVGLHSRLGLDEAPANYINHPWFYWSSGINRESSGYYTMTKENLKGAPVGSVVIWEKHYGNRLQGDVPLGNLTGDKSYVQLAQMYADDMTKVVYLFQKKDGRKDDLTYYNEAVAKSGTSIDLLIRRANYYMGKREYQKAQADVSAANSIDDNSLVALITQGQIYNATKNYTELSAVADKIIVINDEVPTAYTFKGIVLFGQSNFKAAIDQFKLSLEKNKEQSGVNYNIGISYLRLQNTQEACKYFRLEKAKKSPHSSTDQMLKQHCGEK